jgi:lipoprotein NlpD
MEIIIFTKNLAVRSRLGFAALLLIILSGCLGGRYQAPVAEQSQTFERQAVVIVTESDDRPSRYIGARNRESSANPVANPNASTDTSTRQSVAIAATLTLTERPGVHRVAAGDTLYSIAFQYNLDFRSLALANNLNPPYTIVLGQELMLDLNRQAMPGSSAGSVALTSGIGTPVSDNSVATTRAATNSVRGVIRQPIVRAPVTAEPGWRWPVQGRILSPFQNNGAGDSGLNIATSTGQAIHAAASGEVVYAGNGIQGSGNLIILRHNDRFLSAYAHNSKMLVSEGDAVQAGDQIGEAGVSPNGTQMLHFEIRMDGNPVDPARYLPPQ